MTEPAPKHVVNLDYDPADDDDLTGMVHGYGIDPLKAAVYWEDLARRRAAAKANGAAPPGGDAA
jgi:hypothetical protein